jgi:glutathione synthase
MWCAGSRVLTGRWWGLQWLQSTLWTQHGIRTVRKTMKEISEQGSVGGEGQLLVDGWTASVVYFRAGYTPVDYYTDAEWDARQLVEQSRAAKCPTVTYQLAGVHPPHC